MNTPTPTASPTPAPSPTPTPTPVPPVTSDQRFGVVVHTQSKSAVSHFLDTLGVDWFLDFDADMSQVPEGANKVPFIRVPTGSSVWTSGQVENIESLSDADIAALGFPTRTELRSMAQASPGAHWYIFGEANRYGYITGKRWAPVFRYITTQLRLGDPTARIIGTSILNWDYTCVGCGGYQTGQLWMIEFIAEHQRLYGEKPRVDAWGIDVYPIDWNDTPNGPQHAPIVFDQLVKFRQYLDSHQVYASTPIWITEIAVHWGFDGWTYVNGRLVPVGNYHWDKMSGYLTTVLDWLQVNASAYKIEKWFFFKTWVDFASTTDYAGIIFFDGTGTGASLNCLGDAYRARAIGSLKVKCDASGGTVPE